MAEFDLVIRNGTIGTASAVFRADLGIKDGRIAAIADRLGAGQREVDATDRLVLPGGVDTHTHIEEPRGGPTRNADTFASGSASAAAGGTTTVISFARQAHGESLAEQVAAHHLRGQQSRIDYSFHMIITEPTPKLLQEELPALVEAGHRSLKIFLTYEGARVTDGDAIRVLAAGRKLGALVCIHAEHHELIQFYTEALLAAGLTLPKHHAWSKPMVVESECVHRVCAMAEALDTPIQVFHVSGAESAEEIERAQKKGLKVWAETCPQYLVLTADDLDRPGFEGAKYIFSPAGRTRSDQDALWDAIRRGIIFNVSSDHAPTRYAGPDGKLAFGDDAPFTKVPNGLPGLATRMPILFSEGVAKGRIDLQTFVAITATNPARLFGLDPRKGTIAIGSDADIAIWNPTRRTTITNSLLLHDNDHTPYEGLEVTGWPETTFVRGTAVVQHGELLAPPGHGQFLPRAPYALIQPRGVFPTPFNPVDGVTL